MTGMVMKLKVVLILYPSLFYLLLNPPKIVGTKVHREISDKLGGSS